MSVAPFVDRSSATFDESLFARLSRAGNPAADPIFVVGLQRSGSTLVEQILASHPLIEGTTELMAMQYLWGDLTKMARSEGRSAWQWILMASPE